MNESELKEDERLCSAGDVAEGETHVVDREDVNIAVFCIDGEYYALNNECPHQGGPLGEGRVKDGCVYCPWHGWQFEVNTGQHIQGIEDADSYDVEVVDGDIYVDL